MVDLKGQYADIKQEVDTLYKRLLIIQLLLMVLVHQFQKNLENI